MPRKSPGQIPTPCTPSVARPRRCSNLVVGLSLAASVRAYAPLRCCFAVVEPRPTSWRSSVLPRRLVRPIAGATVLSFPRLSTIRSSTISRSFVLSGSRSIRSSPTVEDMSNLLSSKRSWVPMSRLCRSCSPTTRPALSSPSERLPMWPMPTGPSITPTPSRVGCMCPLMLQISVSMPSPSPGIRSAGRSASAPCISRAEPRFAHAASEVGRSAVSGPAPRIFGP